MAVITISRQGGAGGLTLAHLLANKLEYALIDEEIINMVAKDAKVTSQWVRSIEKDAGGLMHRMIDGLISGKYIDRLIGDKKGYIDETVYIETLYKVIPRIAEEDNCVILGRGGQYILKDLKNAYHILLTADKQDRIKFMVEHHKFSPSKAKNIVEQYDTRRARLYRKLGEVGYDNPELYHLVINTSKLSLEKARDIVVDLIK
jgi:cytidylate kinase